MNIENSAILVTGATGLIGYNLVVCLLANKNKVYAVGRKMDKLKSTFEELSTDSNLILIEQNIGDAFPTLEESIDYIFHAAGPMEGDIIRNYPVNVILPNINGLINCLEYCKAEKESKDRLIRLIVFSSVTLYNNYTDHDITVSEAETKTAEPVDAISAPYSESKRMSEVIATAYHRQYGLDVLMARFSTVYGPTKNIPNTAFYEFIKKALAGEDITLNSNGIRRRDNIYVDDAIEGLMVIAMKGKPGEAYNVSSNGEGGNYASVDEIALCVAKEARKISDSFCTSINYKSTVGERSAGLKMDNSKLQLLGWQLTVNLSKGVISTLNAISK